MTGIIGVSLAGAVCDFIDGDGTVEEGDAITAIELEIASIVSVVHLNGESISVGTCSEYSVFSIGQRKVFVDGKGFRAASGNLQIV